jgi:hypothetical protein
MARPCEGAHGAGPGLWGEVHAYVIADNWVMDLCDECARRLELPGFAGPWLHPDEDRGDR